MEEDREVAVGARGVHAGARDGAEDVDAREDAASGDAQDGAGRGESDAGEGLPGLDGSVSMGVDIVEVARIRAILKRSPAFARRAFSEDERAYCEASASPEYHYATRFAAKEAVVKALGTGFSGIGLRDVEVAMNSRGKPIVRLHGRAAEVARELGVTELPLSLSHTHTDAVACALALTADARVEAERAVDPAKELTRRFKEARAWLDELP